MTSRLLPRLSLIAALLGVLLVPVLVLAARVARAHGHDGRVEILVAEPTGPNTVHIEAGVVFANDGDVAEEATVTASLTGPDGTVVGPVPLPKIRSARYGGDVEVPGPGPWAVTVSSTGPEGTAAGTVEVPLATTTTAPTTTVAPAATVAPTTLVTSGLEAAPDSPAAGLLWSGAAVVFAVAVTAGYLIVRRRTETA